MSPKYVRATFNGEELTCVSPSSYGDAYIAGVPGAAVELRGFQQGRAADGEVVDEIPFSLLVHKHGAKRLARMLLDATEIHGGDDVCWVFTDEGTLKRVPRTVRALNENI